MQDLAHRSTAYSVGKQIKVKNLRLKYVSKKDEVKRRVYEETGFGKTIFFQKCQSSTKISL